MLYPEPAEERLLLLGVLALTARFHPLLVAHHAPDSSEDNSLAASDYYAAALIARLAGDAGTELTKPSIERIQALLMLGLHEWGSNRGTPAWMYVGMAIRFAQVMGLEFEQNVDGSNMTSSELCTEAKHLGLPLKKTAPRSQSDSDSFMEQEMRRRTLWSCFTMDRYLGGGRYRRQMIRVEDLEIQLPCSEHAFMFGTRVQTGHLRPVEKIGTLANGDEVTKKIQCEQESMLSRYIRLMELWWRTSKWSCEGGRRSVIPCSLSRLKYLAAILLV